MSAIIKATLIFALVFLAQNANAAVVFPSVVDIDVSEGSVEIVEIAVKNSDIISHEYNVDIIGVELGHEEGEYSFYNFNADELDLFSLTESRFELIQQEERLVQVEVSPSQNTKPQVIVAGVRIIEQSATQGQIGVNSGVVALIFITVDGDNLDGDYQVIDFSSDVQWSLGDVSTFLTIQNNAEKIVQPTGSIIYRNIFGLESKVSDINPEARRIASGQTRTYGVSEQLAWGFGPYFVSLEASPWDNSEISADSHIIWVFSVRSLILLVIFISAVAIIWRYVKRR